MSETSPRETPEQAAAVQQRRHDLLVAELARTGSNAAAWEGIADAATERRPAVSDGKHSDPRQRTADQLRAELMATAYAYGRHDQKHDSVMGRIGNRWLTSPQFAAAVRTRGVDVGDFDDLYRELATDTGEVA